MKLLSDKKYISSLFLLGTAIIWTAGFGVVFNKKYFYPQLFWPIMICGGFWLVAAHIFLRRFDLKISYSLSRKGIIHGIISGLILLISALTLIIYLPRPLPHSLQHLLDIIPVTILNKPVQAFVYSMFIAFAEELFWRGTILHISGSILRMSIYCILVHLCTGSIVLAAAAGGIGILWAWQYQKFKSVTTSLISHFILDAGILLFFILHYHHLPQ
jgi:membrane protease YdiL (CAAX protease family)